MVTFGSLRDGFVNMVARLGTDRDKQAHGQHTFAQLDPATLEAAYRGSAVAKKIVDQPAEDCAREWREWQGSPEEISALEAEEARLNLPKRIINGLQAARLYGGAALYIGLEDGGANPALPINLARVGQGSLRYLTPLTKVDLRAGELQLDPTLPGFGKPEAYYLQRGVAKGEVRIHPDRLVLFTGEETPSGLMRQRDAWGDSSLQAVLDDVRNLDSTKTNIASLVYEAKVDVVKIPNLLQDLAQKGQQYEALILQRMGLSVTAKGINGMLLLDGQEEYEQKHANFANLPEVLTAFMQLTAAAANMPMTVLFGMSPAGMNATGEADMRNYYDRIRAMQSMDVQPACYLLDECLIRSALGTRPEELHYNWRALWQPTAAEKATTAKTLVEALKGLKDLQVISDPALGETAVNVLTESGAMPGLEDAVKDNPWVEPDDVEGGNPDTDPDASQTGEE